jgi:hypothetical protein
MSWLPSKATVSLALLGAISTSGTLATAAFLTAKPPVAAQWCQCVGYIAIYGHVGVVQNVLPNGQIEVRGANQGGSQIEYTCTNVNTIRFGTSVNGRSDVSFWVRGSSNPNPQPGGFLQVTFSGWVMSTNGVTFVITLVLQTEATRVWLIVRRFRLTVGLMVRQ